MFQAGDSHVRWLLGGAILGVAATVALTACDPEDVSTEPAQAQLDIHVGPTGGAHADLLLAPELRDDLVPTARRLARAVLGSAAATVRIEGNDGGADFAVISVPQVYRRGEEATVSIAVDAAAADALQEVGVTTLDVGICAPFVPFAVESSAPIEADAPGCRYWTTDLSSETLTATLRLSPDPGRWYRSVVLVVVTLASAITAAICFYCMRRTDRGGRLLLAAAAPGVVAFAIGLYTKAHLENADNLAVAGDLDGPALTVATWGPYVLLPLGVACAVFAFLAVRSLRHSPVGQQVPGR